MDELKEVAKNHKKQVFLLISLALLSGLTIILQAYFIVKIVEQVFLQDASFTDVFPMLVSLLIVLFGRTLFNYFNGKTGVRLATKVKHHYRKTLLQKYLRTNMEVSLHGQSGQKVSVILDTVDELDSYYSQYIPQIIQSLIIPIMLFISIFIEHYLTGIIILLTAPFIPVFMVIIGFNTKDKSEEQLDKMAAFSGKFLDTLQGLTTLKLYGKSKQQKQAIEESSLHFRDATMGVLKIAFTNSLALEFISMLSIGLIALEIAIRLIIFQDIHFFTGFLMLILAPEFYNKLKELGSAFHTGGSSKGAFNKLKQEWAVPEVPVPWGNEELTTADEPPTLQLTNASFHYEKEKQVLKNITVELPATSQVAIVGKTGAGKSTLLHVLAGIISLSAGEFLINHKPREVYTEKSWFNQLSYISQHPYLFSGSITENIAIGSNQSATMAEIEAAAEQAGIAEFIASLPQKYNTLVGEAGQRLSGGEKQRVALARAFLKQPSVILFDEPTVGLDLQTEQILQRSIQELAVGATLITAAHRLYTIQNADLILLMDHGELIASGRHEELVATIPAYRSMISLQQGS